MLEAPRLQIAMKGSFAIHAVLCPGTARKIQVSHVEIRSDGHLWLGSVCGAVVADPFELASSVLLAGAQIALSNWLEWCGVQPT